MTKLFSIIAVAVATTFVACGPSAEEKAKIAEREAFVKDSISASLNAQIEGAMTETAPVDTTAAPATETATTATEAPKH